MMTKYPEPTVKWLVLANIFSYRNQSNTFVHNAVLRSIRSCRTVQHVRMKHGNKMMMMMQGSGLMT